MNPAVTAAAASAELRNASTSLSRCSRRERRSNGAVSTKSGAGWLGTAARAVLRVTSRSSLRAAPLSARAGPLLAESGTCSIGPTALGSLLGGVLRNTVFTCPREPRPGAPQRIKVTVSQLPSMRDALRPSRCHGGRRHSRVDAHPARALTHILREHMRHSGSATCCSAVAAKLQLRHRHTLASAYEADKLTTPPRLNGANLVAVSRRFQRSKQRGALGAKRSLSGRPLCNMAALDGKAALRRRRQSRRAPAPRDHQNQVDGHADAKDARCSLSVGRRWPRSLLRDCWSGRAYRHKGPSESRCPCRF